MAYNSSNICMEAITRYKMICLKGKLKDKISLFLVLGGGGEGEEMGIRNQHANYANSFELLISQEP